MTQADDRSPGRVWSDVVGQERVVEVLQSAVRSIGSEPGCRQRRPGMTHAWLLHRAAGSGRSVAARAFAAALQCADGGCGQCHECRTALARHARRRHGHRDRAAVDQDRPGPRAGAARGPRGRRMGRWRVIIIEDADRLTETAADVLLKAIEEPPPRTVWMLCAPEPRGRHRHDPQPVPAPGPAHAVGRGGRRPAGPPRRHRPGDGRLRRAVGAEPHRPGPPAGPRRGGPDPAPRRGDPAAADPRASAMRSCSRASWSRPRPRRPRRRRPSGTAPSASGWCTPSGPTRRRGPSRRTCGPS